MMSNSQSFSIFASFQAVVPKLSPILTFRLLLRSLICKRIYLLHSFLNSLSTLDYRWLRNQLYNQTTVADLVNASSDTLDSTTIITLDLNTSTFEFKLYRILYSTRILVFYFTYLTVFHFFITITMEGVNKPDENMTMVQLPDGNDDGSGCGMRRALFDYSFDLTWASSSRGDDVSFRRDESEVQKLICEPSRRYS